MSGDWIPLQIMILLLKERQTGICVFVGPVMKKNGLFVRPVRQQCLCVCRCLCHPFVCFCCHFSQFFPPTFIRSSYLSSKHPQSLVCVPIPCPAIDGPVGFPVSYGGPAVGTAFLPHDVAAQESDGEEEDGQDDATAGELVPIHACLLFHTFFRDQKNSSC